jgi:hypothetical protein
MAEAKTKTVVAVDIPEPTEAEVAHEATLNADELLADLPKLKEPTKLRLRERNRLLTLMFNSQALAEDGKIDGRDEQLAILDLMAGIDEFAESIAVNQEEYVVWAEGRTYEAFIAILDRYAVALGK